MHTSEQQLCAQLEHIKASPKNSGLVDLIVCRPEIGERRVLETATLDSHFGLIGDNWLAHGFKKSANGQAHPEMQLNLMNSHAIACIAQQRARWPLAGDQFFVDLDLSADNLPSGTRLSLGDAIIEVTAEPHLGCQKFAERFGRQAALFVNSELGKSLNLRGINAKVVQPGIVSTGSSVKKI